jgi:hypothetical protein
MIGSSDGGLLPEGNFPYRVEHRRSGRFGYRWVMKKPGPMLASERKSSPRESNKWIAGADDRIF